MKTLDLSSLEILHIYNVCISNHKNLWKEYLNYCIHVLYIFIQVLSRNSSSSNVIKEYIKRLYAYSSILLQFSCCYENFQAFHFNERDVVCIQRLGFLERKKAYFSDEGHMFFSQLVVNFFHFLEFFLIGFCVFCNKHIIFKHIYNAW